MKQYLNIILFLFLAILVSCQDEMVTSEPMVEGKKVELNMSVLYSDVQSASSRVLGEYTYTDGNHPSLWVVVFDKNGYLVEWAKATEQQVKTGASLHETAFKVTLHATSEPRILHFLANYADELTLEYGHESNVIGAMMVGNQQDVYWQRKVLENGVNAEDSYTRIPLLRNFAKITVNNNYTDHFQMTGFYVVNPPKYGMVAPFSNGQFVDYLSQPGAETTKGYFDLLNEGYKGTTPITKEHDTEYAESKWIAPDGASYIYENPFHEDADETVSILLEGKFRSSTSESFDDVTKSYYHVDMVYVDESEGGTGLPVYFHVLRNFHYQYNINRITGAGKSNPEEAIASPAGNNLIGSVIIKDMPNISNGTAALYVLYTDTVTVTDDPIRLKYKYTDNINISDTDPDYHQNEEIVTQFKGDAIFRDYKFLSNTTDAEGNYELLDADEITNDNLYADDNGWSVIVLYPNPPGDYTQTQTLTILNQDTKLSRDVVFQMRPRMNYTVTCTEEVPNKAGSPVTVQIYLPDGLNENLFPLEFSIESDDDTEPNKLLQYLSPKNTEEMSVRTGNSIVKNETVDFTSEPSFQYIKNLSYEDYLLLESVTTNGVVQRVFPCEFITNVDASASTVYVYNKYFHLASDSFVNYIQFEMSASFGETDSEQYEATRYYGEGKEVELTFTTNDGGIYELSSSTLDTFSVSGENASISGNVLTLTAGGTYTITCETNTWGEQASISITTSRNNKTVTTTAEGGFRNLLFIKPKSISGGDNNTTIKISSNNKVTDYNSWNSATSLGTKNSILTNGAIYEVEDLETTDSFYLCYRQSKGIFSYSYYNSGLIAAEALASGTLEVTFGNN